MSEYLDTSAASEYDEPAGPPAEHPAEQPLAERPADALVEVRRNGLLSGAVAIAALLVAVACFWRGGTVDVLFALVMLVVTGAQAWTAYDARTPLLLVDAQGVRIRFGRSWRGIPWAEVDEVEHLPRPRSWRGLLRDGRLAVLLAEEDEAVAELPAGARRHALVTQRLYGVPFAVPLGLGTRVHGADADLTEAITELAAGRAGVVEVDPSLAAEVEAEDIDAGAAGSDTAERAVVTDTAERAAVPDEVAPDEMVVDDLEVPDDTDPVEDTIVASPTPSPLREPTVAIRADVRWEPEAAVGSADADVTEIVAALSDPDEQASAAGDDPEAVTPAAQQLDQAIDEPVEDPLEDPVIGPQLTVARTRIGLSIDTLAERTRIRPHVIEAMERDDFGPCGGDFYARGHLRTLARVLGIEAAPLLADYDERYASGPVNPRSVFEAELATGPTGTIRSMRSGPNWSVLVAAVMAVVLIWSVARLITDGSSQSDAGGLSLENGSVSSPYSKGAKVPVTLTAAGGGARVVVRGADGGIAFTGRLAYGETRTVKATAPVRVQTSDGSLQVSIDGGEAEALGKTGKAAQKTYTVS
ncbi:MAG: helix-turn-helix domain-containing protein [Nocardioides sp.]|uniref:helix-turn-helix domain-containing protein n=1 Tax=Nocardioides sp. TaxID=35761 RepID=UPI0039E433FB